MKPTLPNVVEILLLFLVEQVQFCWLIRNLWNSLLWLSSAKYILQNFCLYIFIDFTYLLAVDFIVKIFISEKWTENLLIDPPPALHIPIFYLFIHLFI